MKSEDDIGDSLNYLKKLDNSATGFIRDQFPILNNNTLSSKKVDQTRSDQIRLDQTRLCLYIKSNKIKSNGWNVTLCEEWDQQYLADINPTLSPPDFTTFNPTSERYSMLMIETKLYQVQFN